MKLDAKGLRTLEESATPPQINRRSLYFILDNIYDTYNIGGLFRLADALAIKKMYICGDSETPPNHKIKKASIGTYKVVPWEYCTSAVEAIGNLRDTFLGSEGDVLGNKYGRSFVDDEKTKPKNHTSIHTQNSHPITIVAIEQSSSSIPYTDYTYRSPLAFVLGNETTGVAAETLKACNAILEIPMYGINKSLNVIVSAAIVSYHAVSFGLPGK